MTTAVDFLPDLDRIHGAFCRKWNVQGRHRDDLYSAGQVAVVRAVQEFDPARSDNLGVYARAMIRNRMHDELRTCVGRYTPAPVPVDLAMLPRAWATHEDGFSTVEDTDAAVRVLRRMPLGALAVLWDHVINGASTRTLAAWHGVSASAPHTWIHRTMRGDLDELIADPHLDLTSRRPRVWESRHLHVSPYWSQNTLERTPCPAKSP